MDVQSPNHQTLNDVISRAENIGIDRMFAWCLCYKRSSRHSRNIGLVEPQKFHINSAMIQ